MSGEPELHPAANDEWVAYLKQLLQHWGRWDGDLGEEFGADLAEAVRALQETCAIVPADGVVRADTWAVLTGEAAASAEQARLWAT